MTDSDRLGSIPAEAGLFSHAQILHLLKIEFSRARRYGYPLTVCQFQIDRLDHLKDLYGSEIRDKIEDQIARVVHGLSRSSDFLGRLGDRMILILPHTDAEGVRVLMNRVRERLRDVSFEIDGRPVQVTLSAGISSYQDRNALFFDTILKNAGEAMLEVVRHGGNDVIIHRPRSDAPETAATPRGRG